MKFVADTNVLIRAVEADDPDQSRRVAAAINTALLIAVTTPALCEFVWVLRRAYRRSAPDIAVAIRSLIASENVIVDRAAVEFGLAFLDAGADFADGVIAFEGRRLGGEILLTFDAAAREAARRCGMASASP